MALIKRGEIWHYQTKLNGKTFRRSTGHTNRERAEAVAKRLESEVLLRRKRPDGWLKLSRTILREVERIETDISPGQAERAANSFSQFLKWVGEDIDISTITFSMMEDYQRHRLRSCARMTVKKDLDLILRMLRLNGFILAKPGPKRGRETTIRAFTTKELEALFQAVTMHYKPLYATLLFTGARPAEMVPSLRSEHKPLLKSEVDFDSGLIQIRQAKARTGKRPPDRPPVPVPQDVLDLLKIQIERTSESYPFVFTECHNLARDFKATLKRADIPQIDAAGRKLILHSFRHTYASLMAQYVGNNPHLLKAILGHSKITTTDRYCQVKPTMLALEHLGLPLSFTPSSEVADVEVIDVSLLRRESKGCQSRGASNGKAPAEAEAKSS